MRYKILQSPLSENLVVLYDSIEERITSSCLLEDLLMYESHFYIGFPHVKIQPLITLYEFDSKEQFISENPDLIL